MFIVFNIFNRFYQFQTNNNGVTSSHKEKKRHENKSGDSNEFFWQSNSKSRDSKINNFHFNSRIYYITWQCKYIRYKMEKAAIGCRNKKRLTNTRILCESAAWDCSGTLTWQLTQVLCNSVTQWLTDTSVNHLSHELTTRWHRTKK